jgi:drug/metabolite transporter (DMT)-like permease
MTRKYFFALIAAVATGLPQGIDAKPLLRTTGLIPLEMILIVSLLGLVGGAVMAVGLIKERSKNSFFLSKYIDLCIYFLVGVLCIGLPIFVQNFGAPWQSSIFISAYFLTAAGIGLLVGGAVFYAVKKP